MNPTMAINGEETEHNGNTFLETFRLVQSPVERQPVPNYLADTTIFAKSGLESKTLVVTPVALNFEIFALEKRCTNYINMMNITNNSISVHILQPQTKYYRVHYEKLGRLGPGGELSCQVEFVPTEWRYYYDCIRIHCPEEENVIVPLHAYPAMRMEGFPDQYLFPHTAVGQKQETTFTLCTDIPVEFEFVIEYVQFNKAFTVSPMEGQIQKSYPVVVTVTFAPFRFETSTIKLKLWTSQFNFKPRYCTMFGSSVPGIEMEKVVKEFYKQNPTVQDTQPAFQHARMKIVKKKPKEQNIFELQYKGYQFPAQLNCVSAVNKVLNQKANMLGTIGLKHGQWKKQLSERETKQIKILAFEDTAQLLTLEERQNQLKWQTKLGEDLMDPNLKAMEKERWDQICTNYFKSQVNYSNDKNPQSAKCLFRRTTRQYDQLPDQKPNFNPLKNDPWPIKYDAKRLFMQAVHTIIIKNRFTRRLCKFKELIAEWQAQKEDYPFEYLDMYEKRQKLLTEIDKNYKPTLADLPSRLCCHSFKHQLSVEHRVKDLNTFPRTSLTDTEFLHRKVFLYENLLVPQHYKLQDYEAFDNHDADFCFLNHDPYSYSPILQANLTLPKSTPGKAQQPEIALYCTRKNPSSTKCGLDSDDEFRLKMPDYMLHHVKSSMEKLFNPIACLLTFQEQLLYSELHPDSHLSPLPRPRMPKSTQSRKKSVKGDEIIEASMGWKFLCSPALWSIFNKVTLPENAPLMFTQNMLPASPAILHHFPKDIVADEEPHKSKSSSSCKCGVSLETSEVMEKFHAPEDTLSWEYKIQDMYKQSEMENNLMGKKIKDRLIHLSGMLRDNSKLFKK
ncbi:cilia- and flagella-associated protein 221-like [Argonauta hians]